MRSEESGFESMYTKKRFKIMNFFGQQLYNLSSVATSLTGRYLYKKKQGGHLEHVHSSQSDLDKARVRNERVEFHSG